MFLSATLVPLTIRRGFLRVSQSWAGPDVRASNPDESGYDHAYDSARIILDGNVLCGSYYHCGGSTVVLLRWLLGLPVPGEGRDIPSQVGLVREAEARE
jgi:hypothetical protein